jgi:hypothetical protein
VVSSKVDIVYPRTPRPHCRVTREISSTKEGVAVKDPRSRSKQAYWFGHDANVRRDPKILAMRTVYGAKGYGWYWILVEMMRENADYKVNIGGKYSHDVLATEMDCTKEEAAKFVEDCISEFQLFQSDGVNMWSDYLMERMEVMEGKSKKGRRAAGVRWHGDASAIEVEGDGPTHAMQSHGLRYADAMQIEESREQKEEDTTSEKRHTTRERDEAEEPIFSKPAGSTEPPVAQIDDMRRDTFRGHQEDICLEHANLVITSGQREDLMRRFALDDQGFAESAAATVDELDLNGETPHYRQFVEACFAKKRSSDRRAIDGNICQRQRTDYSALM